MWSAQSCLHCHDPLRRRVGRENVTTVKTRPLAPWLIAAAVLTALLLAAAFAYHVALQRVQGAITSALGPRATLGSVSVGLTGIELRNLRIAAEPGRWPVADELRAARVVLVPSLWSVLRGPWRLASVAVHDASVSVLRTREGKLRVLPALLERSAAQTPSAATGKTATPALRIDRVTLAGVAVEFFDASVRTPAHRMKLERLTAELGPLMLPALDAPLQLELKATFKGPQRDGTLSIAGTLTPATRDAQLAVRLAGVDLVALQPYLIKAAEAGVKRGSLDLKLDAKVAQQRLHAPGRVTLTGLELDSSHGGLLGTFAGVPRQAVLAAMSRDGRIELAFTLDGRLDDARFSLNDSFATRLAAGLAETLGVSVGGVVQGVGSVIKGLFGR